MREGLLVAVGAMRRKPYRRRHSAEVKSPPQPVGANRLGEWIKANRAAQDLSQRDLAERASISRSYLCDIEHGRGAKASIAVLEKIALALGASSAEILRASGILRDEGAEDHSNEYRLLAVFRDLSDEGRLGVVRFARFIHGEEHRYVQPPLHQQESEDGTPSQVGPSLFDELKKM
jgi:transcriptional regulator with XRE-family HTH domain